MGRRRPVLFVLLTFAISWGSLGALFPIGPAVAALILAWRADGSRGVRDLVRPLARWRFAPRFYGFVLVGPAIIGAVVYVAWRTFGYGTLPVHWGLVLLAPLLTVAFAVIAVFEEIGWRGYLLSALEERFSPLRSALLVGVVWGAWHLPLLVVGGELNDRLPLFAYPAITIPGSLIYAWLYHRTGESLLAVTLLHGAQQAFILPVVWNIYRSGQDMTAFFTIVIVAVWIVGGAIALAGPRFGRGDARERHGGPVRTASSGDP